MEEVKQEIKEMPEAEMKAQEMPKAFKINADARISLNVEEVSFLIELGQIFMPFVQFSQGISKITAFAEYLKSKLVETKQVTFENLGDQPTPEILPDLREQETEEDKKASEELSKMRVVHNSRNIQEELANQ
jgi:hypothetical protein